MGIPRTAQSPVRRCALGPLVDIMEDMSGKLTTLLGIVGITGLGIYFTSRGSRRVPSKVSPKPSMSSGGARSIDIDDDAVAEIIRRARPALERARQLYAW